MLGVMRHELPLLKLPIVFELHPWPVRCARPQQRGQARLVARDVVWPPRLLLEQLPGVHGDLARRRGQTRRAGRGAAATEAQPR